MLKKTIKYTDYNNAERTEDFYFNLSKAEVMEMEMTTTGGLAEQITKIIAAQDNPSIIKIFKNLVLKSYGEKSPDGKRFIKNDECRISVHNGRSYRSIELSSGFGEKRFQH